MTILKPTPWSQPDASAAPFPSPVRLAAAALLRSASAALSRMAARIATLPADASRQPPVLEFHADAGAPEGALYVNGELVGWLPGVQRL